MHCEDCLGTGTVLLRHWPGGVLQPYPCWVCGGSGLSHCCEGERPGNVGRREHPMMGDGDDG